MAYPLHRDCHHWNGICLSVSMMNANGRRRPRLPCMKVICARRFSTQRLPYGLIVILADPMPDSWRRRMFGLLRSRCHISTSLTTRGMVQLRPGIKSAAMVLCLTATARTSFVTGDKMKNLPALTLDDVTPRHLDTYLDSLRQTLEMIAELATEWGSLEEAEQLHFRLDVSRSFGLRRLLGRAYQDGRLDATQIASLTVLDRQMLAQAAMIETVYGYSLRQLVRELFGWGTPLSTQPSTLQIETTTTALAELVTT